MVNKTEHGKSQPNGTGLKMERHREGADRVGGKHFISTTERLRKRLAISGSAAELKKRRQHLSIQR